MQVGMTAIFQNPHDARPDHEIYRDELRLADQAEPLGFDSIWGVEHHFTDYTMCPDVLQSFVGCFSHAGMPYDEAERSMRLFGREVMPVLQKLDAGRPAAERPESRVPSA